MRTDIPLIDGLSLLGKLFFAVVVSTQPLSHSYAETRALGSRVLLGRIGCRLRNVGEGRLTASPITVTCEAQQTAS